MTEKKRYHHGDLRESLLAEATTVIAESGVEGLSMRGLAERAGVSRTAAYHHFRDKNELLCAIAEDGFRNWQKHFHVLLDRTPEDLESWFHQFVQVYIEFARDHAQQYDLMFGRAIWKNSQPTASLKKLSTECFQSYVEFITHWQAQGLIADQLDGLRVAQVTWSTMHGFSRLLNDGIYLEGEAVRSICDSTVKLLISNLERASI
ncbi:MAG: TetR/AcrR family transcriptional regulator [Endozoicomonas sp.]